MTDALRDAYERDGFVIMRGLFDGDALREINAACDELQAMASDFQGDEFVDVTFFNMMRACNPFACDLQQHAPMPGILRRVTYPYAISPILDRYRTHPNLIHAVASILGPDVVQVVNQVNFSPPNIGTGWGWHQDYRFRRQGLEDPMRNFMQTVTAIDRCHLGNGGLRLIPGSHRLGMLTLDKENERAETYFDPTLAITPTLEPGDSAFFNPLVIHGSGANRSDALRRVYINGFARASATPYGIPVLKHGDIVRHREGKMEYEGDRATLPLASKY